MNQHGWLYKQDYQIETDMKCKNRQYYWIDNTNELRISYLSESVLSGGMKKAPGLIKMFYILILVLVKE